MVQRLCSAGSSKQNRLNRTHPCGTKPSAQMAPLIGRTSPGMPRPTVICARRGKRCNVIGETSKRSARALSRTTLLYIAPESMLVMPVNTSHFVAPKCHSAKYGEVFTSHRVMWHVRLHKHLSTRRHAGNLKLDRLRLRGMSGAHDEFLLTASTELAQNGKTAQSATTRPQGRCPRMTANHPI